MATGKYRLIPVLAYVFYMSADAKLSFPKQTNLRYVYKDCVFMLEKILLADISLD